MKLISLSNDVSALTHVPCVGIDLGTTNSVVALSEQQRATIIPVNGAELTPTVLTEDLSVKNNSNICADTDNNVRANTDYNIHIDTNTTRKLYHDFKRFMETPDLPLHNGLTALDLSAAMLAHIKTQTERALSTTSFNAVITVPARFSDVARKATKLAAQKAGINVIRLINEPTAAAIAYGLNQGQAMREHNMGNNQGQTTREQNMGTREQNVSNTEGVYLVYDFGGGTFDATVLRIQGHVFQVLGTTGDLNLGGNNIDRDIATFLNWNPADITSLYYARILKERYNDMRKENIANELFEGIPNVACPVSDVVDCIDTSISMHVQRTVFIVQRLLADLHMKVGDIHGVPLVGGSTRLRSVVSALSQYFGASKVFDAIDPDRAVALGAAVHCEALSSSRGTAGHREALSSSRGTAGHREALSSSRSTAVHCEALSSGTNAAPPVKEAPAPRPLLLDIIPSSIGIQTVMGYVENIIPKYTPTPIHVDMQFSTIYDNQKSILIHVVQGDDMMAANCTSLGSFVLKGVRPMPKGVPQIHLSIDVDEDGIITVQASESISQVQQSLVIEPYVVGTSAQNEGAVWAQNEESILAKLV